MAACFSQVMIRCLTTGDAWEISGLPEGKKLKPETRKKARKGCVMLWYDNVAVVVVVITDQSERE